MTTKFIMLLLLPGVALFAAPSRSNYRSNHTGLLVSGEGQLSPSFVKTGEFPIGAQLGYQSGGSIGYGGVNYDFLLNFRFHDAFYSFESLNVLYRRYRGFVLGICLRYHEEEYLLEYYLFSNIGVGFTFDGVFDRYYLIDQYMIYPRFGVELYSAYQPFPDWNFLLVNFVVPFTYSLRLSGNYLETGLRVEMVLRF